MKFVTALAFTDTLHYLDMARVADECGWNAFALSEHFVHPERWESKYPYTQDGKPFWPASAPLPDNWVAIGAMAAVTTRLRFMTNVCILPLRHPFVVAKAVGTAAVLSRNRVALGVGVGWMKEEFDLMGQDFPNRGRRTDEAIEIVRTLWRGGMVEHHGRFYDFARLEMSPAPTEPVPIYIGGESEAALRRAARHGDGWISTLLTIEGIRDTIGRINALRREYGRAQAPFEFIVAASDAYDIEGYRRVQDCGATALMTQPWLLYGEDPKSLAGKQRALQRFAEDIICKMS